MNVFPSDFNSICRVCLKRSDNLICLFGESSSSLSVSYRDMFEFSTNILLSLDDGLPDSVCERCNDELVVSYTFMQKSKQADDYLQSVKRDSHMIPICEVKSEVKLEPCESQSKDATNKNASLAMEYHCEAYFMKSEEHYDMETDDGNVSDNAYDCHEYSLRSENKCNKQIDQQRNTQNEKNATKSMYTVEKKIKNRELSHSSILSHAPKRYSCSLCDCFYSKKHLLNEHVTQSHAKEKKIKKFTCEHCGKAFHRKPNFVTHLRIHTGEMPYSCALCPRKFSQLTTLIYHKRTHTGEKPYICKVCGKGFRIARHLNRHQSAHSDDRPFLCLVCNKSFKSSAALKQHTKLHTNDKPFICDQCNTAFTVKPNLIAHIKKAHSEHSGECVICQKLYRNLPEHMTKHSGEKPFRCELCDKRFSLRRGLLLHAKRHLNANKYKCEIEGCNKTFNAQWVLDCHKSKHTGVGQIKCEYCSKEFPRRCTLTIHMKSDHPDQKL